jgi:hypothetical protein
MSWASSSKAGAWGRSWATLPPESLSIKFGLISSGRTKIELQAQLDYAIHYFNKEYRVSKFLTKGKIYE